MDIETAQRLNEATRDFYAANAASFSSTRERPWEGWRRLARHVGNAIDHMAASRKAASEPRSAGRDSEPFRVLDVGCGNMRFERFLAEEFPGQPFAFACMDSCPALAGEGLRQDAAFQEADVMELIRKGDMEGMLDDMTATSSFHLSVAFGLMHHVPLDGWRRDLLRALVGHTAPGGIAAVAFWQFAKNPKLREKVERTTAEGCAKLGIGLDVNEGDYLLGWQGSADRLRFCHSFSDEEVDSLADEAQRLGASVVDSYSADGPDGMSNRYVVLRCGRSSRATSTR